ncbi:MAG: fatty acid desaturase CarF family protein [Maricaulaceae bacterium]|jgi:ubiquitin-conjugating enzyme E2 variant
MAEILLFIVQVLAGLLIADFVSGLVHWLEDNYGEPDWPIVGGAVASTMRHHENPRRMLGVSYLVRNGPTMLVTALCAVPVLAIFGINPVTMTALLVGFFANETHAWAHRTPEENGPVITALQKTGLVISFRHHAAHHRHGKDSRYCAVTCLLNPALDRIGFWRGLELAIWRVFKVEPRFDPTVRDKHRRSIRAMAARA